MIDFHTHILPEVDDGPKTYEESVDILKEAKKVGFDKIISTSHYVLNCYEIPEYKREKIIDELNQEENLPQIFLGNEIFLTHNIFDLLNEYKASTINKTNYILLEFPEKQKNIDNLINIIKKLKENNYRIILAHPERYKVFKTKFNLLYELKDLGVLFQSNYGSIIGQYGFISKYVIHRMLKLNLISFLGTDIHRNKNIYTNIPSIISKLEKVISKDYLYKITTINPEKILNGENL